MEFSSECRVKVLPGIIVLFAAAAMATPESASAGCGFGDINAANAQVSVVTPAKLHFVEDDSLVKGCPSDSVKCQKKGYVVAGDVVLTGAVQGAYICTGYVTARGSALNEWLPTAALEPASPDQQHPSDWAGKWSMDDNDITITSQGNAVVIHGEAEWKGDISVHTGNLDGVVTPMKDVVAFTMGDDKTLPFAAGDEFDCRVTMVRRGPYLLVRDNDQCGGANVTFTGFYRRGIKTKR